MYTHQEYTSALGGNIVLPLSASFFRNLFSSRNSGFVISSFKDPSQLSCIVSISSLSSCFCSSVSLSTQAALSNFVSVDSGLDTLDEALGALKKEVMVLGFLSIVPTGRDHELVVSYEFCFGFFASAVTRSVAFRFRDMFVVRVTSFDVNVQRKGMRW